MSISHVPYWLDRAPRGRRPSYPRLRGDVDAAVVIVGGGLTGCVCALTFAAAGVKVVLLEADAVGQGATGRAPGLVREDFEASFRQTVSAHGLAAARTLWEGLRRASLDCSATLRRLNARCDLAPLDLFNFAAAGSESAAALRREYQARRAAGLRHSWTTPAALAREAAIESGGAIRTRGARLDPYRACVSVAAAAGSRGAAIYEHSRVGRVRAGRRQVEVTTDAGVVRAEAVIIATPAPLADLKALRRHLEPHVGYAVVTEPLPPAMRRAAGRRAAALRQDSEPPHVLRWLDDRAFFSGADQPGLAARLRDKALVQRTGQLMYELSLLYPEISGLPAAFSWDVTHYKTVDALPLAGTHRNFPRHLFGIGGYRHGAAFAWLAARILLRSFQGVPAKGDELFGFSRIL